MEDANAEQLKRKASFDRKEKVRAEKEREERRLAEEATRKKREEKEAKMQQLALEEEAERQKQKAERERIRRAQIAAQRERERKLLMKKKQRRRSSLELNALFTELLRFRDGKQGPKNLARKTSSILVENEQFLAAAEEYRLIAVEADAAALTLENILNGLDDVIVNTDELETTRKRLLTKIVATVNELMTVSFDARKKEKQCREENRRMDAISSALEQKSPDFNVLKSQRRR